MSDKSLWQNSKVFDSRSEAVLRHISINVLRKLYEKGKVVVVKGVCWSCQDLSSQKSEEDILVKNNCFYTVK